MPAASAPGRVNLIGDHTDYNGGLALPFAIEQRTSVSVDKRRDSRVRIASAQRDRPAQVDLDDLSDAGFSNTGWSAYVTGSISAIIDAGHEIGGMDIAIDSDIPIGAGLSSSAALCCATVLAVAATHHIDIDPAELARLAHTAESRYAGVDCGELDQAAICFAETGKGVLFDAASPARALANLDFRAADLVVLIIDTGVRREVATSDYAARRTACETAARVLGLTSLSEIEDLAAASRVLDDDGLRLCRHVVTENARVRQAVDYAGHGRLAAVGGLLTASHASLRDDYRVSCPELDTAVDAAIEAGALGARLTGAGFGGCAIALMPADAANEVTGSVIRAAATARHPQPSVWQTTPSRGAEIED